MKSTCAHLVWLAAISACCGTVRATPAPEEPPREIVAAEDFRALMAGELALAVDLYRKLGAGEGNLAFSPMSIRTALAMTYAGARGETAEEMAKVLHFTLEQEKLHPAFSKLLGDLERCSHDAREEKKIYELETANSLWGQEGFPFRAEFLDLVSASYDGTFSRLDFQTREKAERARKTINSWVAERTQKKINELIPPNILDPPPPVSLVLVNTLYFQSRWDEAFQKAFTVSAPFHLASGKQVEVPLMHRSDSFPHLAGNGFQAVEIPYASKKLSLIVFLPDAAGGIARLEKALSPEKLTKWLQGFRQRKVDLWLPRFKVTGKFLLKEALGSMGMPKAFVLSVADFSGISPASQAIKEVVHETYIDLNEEGTEAAAATALITYYGKWPDESEPVPFKADHPFFWLIRHASTGSILFMGRVANPKE